MPEDDKIYALVLPLSMHKAIAAELEYAAGVRRELATHCPAADSETLSQEAEDSECLVASFRTVLNETLNPAPWF